MRVLEPLIELARGLWTTLRFMFEKPVTVQYPEQKKPVKARFRGRHVLHRYENGLEKCIGCSLCAAASTNYPLPGAARRFIRRRC